MEVSAKHNGSDLVDAIVNKHGQKSLPPLNLNYHGVGAGKISTTRLMHPDTLQIIR